MVFRYQIWKVDSETPCRYLSILESIQLLLFVSDYTGVHYKLMWGIKIAAIVEELFYPVMIS